MALILRNGDYVPDNKGGFQKAEDAQEVLERILWKLSVRRGSFPFLPDLGSRLHLLGRVPAREREGLARQYVTEAISDEPVNLEDLTRRRQELVEQYQLEDLTLVQEGDRGRLALTLTWQGEPLTATVEVGGLT